MMNGLKSWLIMPTLFLVALLAPGCTSATAGLDSVPTIQTTEHQIEPGDKIRITVLDLQGADGEFVIDQSGIISLPLIDDVKIAGLTLREAESAIEQVLLDKRILVRPSVTLQALSVRPVYILGEVGKPGEYAYKEGLTVFSIISLAGGYTYRADTRSVMITRVVNGNKVTGKADENTIVMPGDQIRVVEKWF
jgi:protein involved in polysaccharide export with SLBB domain